MKNRTDHLTIVELLKRPIDFAELRELKINKRDLCYCRNIIEKGNVIYDVKLKIIYIKRNHRSILTLNPELRCFRDISRKYGIPKPV